MGKTIHSADNERLLALLVERRKTAGLTQEALAQRLSKPQSFVSKYETGERRLDVIEFIDVASAIGFDPAALIRLLHRQPRTKSTRPA